MGAGKARRACVKHTPDLEDLVQITKDAERLNNFYVDYMLKIKCIRIDFNVATRKHKITYIACFTIFSRLVTPQSCPTCEEELRALGQGEGCKVPGYLALSAQVGKAAAVSKGSPPRKSHHPGVGIGEKVHWRGEGRRFQKWWGDPMAGTTSPSPVPFLSQLTVWYYSHHSSLYVFATFMWHT